LKGASARPPASAKVAVRAYIAATGTELTPVIWTVGATLLNVAVVVAGALTPPRASVTVSPTVYVLGVP